METLKTKNNKSMKNIYLLLAFSGLLVMALFGFNNHRSVVASQVNSPAEITRSSELPTASAPALKSTAPEFDYTALAPVTPAEADFSDVAPENPFANLNPVEPKEASFEDLPAANQDLNVTGLSPATPSEADFDDTLLVQPAGINLQPVIPSEATFEDLN